MPEVTYRMLVSDARTGKERTLFFRTTEQDSDVAVQRVEHHARVTVLDVEVISA